MRASLDLAVLEAGREHDRLVGAAWMAPDHAAGIAHEAAEACCRRGVGDVEVAPSRAFLPGGHRFGDGSLVEARGAADQIHFGRRFDGAGEHHWIVAVGESNAVKAEAEAEALIVKGKLGPVDL